MTKKRARTLGLMIFESVLIYASGVTAIYVRFGADGTDLIVNELGWLKLVVSMLMVQFSFYLSDLYDFRMIRRSAVLAMRIFQAIGLAALLLALTFYVLPQMMLGRGVFIANLLLTL